MKTLASALAAYQIASTVYVAAFDACDWATMEDAEFDAAMLVCDDAQAAMNSAAVEVVNAAIAEAKRHGKPTNDLEVMLTKPAYYKALAERASAPATK